MAQVLSLTRSPTTAVHCSSSTRLDPTTHRRNLHQSWISKSRNIKCKTRITCLFSDSRKQEQAKKALDSALGGKKIEFENWNKEIKKREEASGGVDAGGGGWFGSGGWFGGSNGDHFWQEAQQASLAVLGIILMYLIIAKGEVMLAVILNPLLYALRGTRRGLTFITSRISQRLAPSSHASLENIPREEGYTHVSAKERVVRKWGSDY
ncbi:uncharacterized protein LOC130783251 [Actinidia eriantha]|uniref:uncharacterized protein LOC130783251 n=1 Tax=Actinidia eriantha TaxID=165200 RepID=UPI00258480CE|nr:uncharacterized protein LOC130783251 [Actinidia eriantha]